MMFLCRFIHVHVCSLSICPLMSPAARSVHTKGCEYQVSHLFLCPILFSALFFFVFFFSPPCINNVVTLDVRKSVLPGRHATQVESTIMHLWHLRLGAGELLHDVIATQNRCLQGMYALICRLFCDFYHIFWVKSHKIYNSKSEQ